MALPPEVEELLEFFNIDSNWVIHLRKNDYQCGCSAFSKSSSGMGGLCEEWQATVDKERASADYQRALKRYEDATTKLAKVTNA